MSTILPAGPDFRRLWLATAISVLGTWAAAIALSVRLYRDTGSAEWVSALYVAEFVPAIVIGVLFANRLDRLVPRRGLVGADLICAGCFAVLAFVHEPAAVVGLALVAGAAAGVFRPVALASVPLMVEEEQLDPANGALTAVDAIMTTAGQALGGVLVTLAGAAVVLFANAATFTLSALLLFGAAALRGAPAAAAGPAENPLVHVGRVVKSIRLRPRLLQVAVASPLMLVMAGAIGALWVPLFLHTDRSSAAVVGIALAMMQVGILCGSILAGRYGAVLAPHYPSVLGVVGLCVAAAGLTNHAWLATVAFFGTGIANGVALVYNRSTLQRETSPGQRTGTIAVLMSAGGIATVLGAVVGGLVAAHWSPATAIVATGVFGVAVVMPAAMLTRPRA